MSHPLLTPKRTVAEIDHILDLTRLEPPAAILDVGCGFGRHSIELARRGFTVTAIDASPAMIERAQHATFDGDGTANFMVHDARNFQNSERFDAAICLFTTLGQMDQKGDNISLLENTYAQLHPGGNFVVEIPQRQVAVANMKRFETITGHNAEARIERRYDAANHIMSEQFEIVAAETSRLYHLRYRLFNAKEIHGLLQDAGFDVHLIHDGFSGKPCDDGSPYMLILCSRPPIDNPPNVQPIA